jgi:Ca2+-binding EF-hand superfamily protein
MQFDNLRRSFEEIDPYKTDLLLRDEFEEILRELCPELNKQEMDYICSKYDTNSDGRL